jgi:DNA-binding SARP family transcriptional activator
VSSVVSGDIALSIVGGARYSATTMKFLLLGPVEFVADGTSIPLGRRRERLVLGALALTAGSPVSVERLTSVAWDGAEPPEHARAAIRVGASRLRKVLAPYGIAIAARGDAYVLDVDPGDVDAHEFRVRVVAAGELTDADERGAALRHALALWRGDVLEDVARPDVRHLLAGDLVELRLDAQRRCIEADIECGRHQQAIAELRGVVASHPTDEGFVGLLMEALVQSGRQAEALDAYAQARRALADELDVDPGPELSRRYTRILRQAAGSDVTSVRRLTVSVQTLPRDVPAFTGRDAEFASLGAAVSAARPSPLVIVTGPGGVGKTALAVHWAHRATSLFPDGQLFVNLRGYGIGQAPSTNEALTQLLLALGEPLASIPPAADGSAAMYRARLAGRRMLIVVDNAATAEQVRPLLPGSPGCGVVVTSRDSLTGLTTNAGAGRVLLRQLNVEHSIAVLRGVVGHRRIRDEFSAAADLAALCGGLPLALRVAAANLAGRPDMSIASYHAEMTSGSVLDALQVDGDVTMGVRATLSSSFDSLSEPAQRLFRLLGVLSGADFTIDTCTALTGTETVAAEQALGALCRAHLVERRAMHRYALHDLVRAYAVELGRGGADVEAVRERFLGYYLNSVNNAAETAYPHRRYLSDESGSDGTRARTFSGRRKALAWLDDEVTNLVAEAVQAANVGPWRFAWQVCDALAGYFWLRRHAALWAEVIGAAERAVEAAADPRMAVLVLNRRGIMHWAYGEYEPAERAFVAVAETARRLGDREREAAALSNLGGITRELGRLAQARAFTSQALTLHLELGGMSSAGSVLINLSMLASDMGEFADSLDYGRRAESIYRQIDHPEGLGAALLVIAEALVDSRVPYAEVVPVLHEAREIYDGVGGLGGQTALLTIHSRAALDDGRPDDALTFAERACTFVGQIKNVGQGVGASLARGGARRALGDHAGAAEDFEAAENDSRAIGIRPGIAMALIAQAEMALADGDSQRARKLARGALEIADRPVNVAAAERLIAESSEIAGPDG